MAVSSTEITQHKAESRRRDRHECLAHLRQGGVRYTFANMATASGGARFEFASDQSLLVYFEELKETGRAESGLPQGEKSRAQARPLQSQIALQANEKVRDRKSVV